MELRDKHDLVAHYRLPYQFTSVPKKKKPKDMPSQHTPDQQNISHQPHQDLHPGPSIPTPSAVPPGSEHHSRGYSEPPHMHQYAPHEPNQHSAMLERLAPSQGHVLGGIRILLSGVNFPSPPTCIYAKFGSFVTGAVRETARFALELETNPVPRSGITRIHLNACCRLHLIQGW